MKKVEINGLVDLYSKIQTVDAENRSPNHTFPEDYTKIERQIAEMMTESTGVHILDSGGVGGRHWQNNRRVLDFRNIPELAIDYYNDGDISITINIFHFLTKHLVIDDNTKKFNAEFQKLAKIYSEESWFELMDIFGDDLLALGYKVSPMFNTYNNGSILSQDIQGFTFYKDDDMEWEPYICFQLHNGADIRGGYTKPRIFKIADLYQFLLDQNHINAFCGCTEVYTDDGGYHWYHDDTENKITDDYSFPKHWKYDKRINGMKCSLCNNKVEFNVDE